MLTWTLKKFEELTQQELYALLQLRTEVFVVEQNCVFQDMDDRDQLCWHLMAWKEGELVAYSRLVPVGVSYDLFPSIGRVATAKNVRRSGIGRMLLEKSIEQLTTLAGAGPIKLGAQSYLKKFYESFGFTAVEEPYFEDGIEHLHMIKWG